MAGSSSRPGPVREREPSSRSSIIPGPAKWFGVTRDAGGSQARRGRESPPILLERTCGSAREQQRSGGRRHLVPQSEDRNMRRSFAWPIPLLTACAVFRGGGPPADTEVWVRSHNASDVDVYLLCGDTDPRWLGTVAPKTGTAYVIPAAQRLCASGLNFFLVVQSQGRGYWVGPVRDQQAESMVLVIEKYAGLSNVDVRSGWRR